MLFDNIQIGDRLEISLVHERSSLSKTHVSQVEEILGENRLLIHVPISYGQLVRLNTNERFYMLFFTDKGMIRFEGEINSFSNEGDLHFMNITLLTDGERIQRREFFRFTCLLPIKFSIIEEYGATTEADPRTLYDGIVKDLGGGGIRFVSNRDVSEKSQIKCILMLGDDCLILMGKVLHRQFFPKSNYKYQYRVEFVGTILTEQEKIIQYIFNEQRKIIGKTRN